MANGEPLEYGTCELIYSVIGEKITVLPLKYSKLLFIGTEKKGTFLTRLMGSYHS